MPMQYWRELLILLAAALVLILLLHRFFRKRARRRELDFTRKLETLLQPKEQIKAVCHQRLGHCIVTGSRIIFEKNGSFSAFPLSKLQKLQGKNEKGNRTTVPKNMASLTVVLDKEYILKNTGPEFEVLAELLQEKLQKKQTKEKK